VVSASNAVDGLRLVSERALDVVLSDIAMTEHDGYWLIGEIQCLPASSRRPPVVATTAFGREHSRDRILAAGFVDLLGKPVDPVVLCQSMAKAAGR